MTKAREIGKIDKIKIEASLRFNEVIELLQIAILQQPDDAGRKAIIALMGQATKSIR